MTINWGALVLVALVTIVAAIAIVGLFSLGIAALTSRTRADNGGGTLVVAGYGCLALSGVIAIYGLYLIVPQFH